MSNLVNNSICDQINERDNDGSNNVSNCCDSVLESKQQCHNIQDQNIVYDDEMNSSQQQQVNEISIDPIMIDIYHQQQPSITNNQPLHGVVEFETPMMTQASIMPPMATGMCNQQQLMHLQQLMHQQKIMVQYYMLFVMNYQHVFKHKFM